MSENSKIEWTDHTFNPWEGCQKAGPGCDNCYAETRNKRFGGGVAVNWGPGALRRRTSESNWHKPTEWNKAHEAFFAEHGRRQRVFCASLADVFDNEVPDEWRQDLFALIHATPNLDWLLLTKRIGNAHQMIGEALIHMAGGTTDLLPGWPWANVWLGATVVNQAEADRDIRKLLETPARVRFLSMEPLLGPVDLYCTRQRIQAQRSQLARAINGETWLDWVIVGGESGPHARPMHPDWARGLRDQCADAGVPFLFKQWGEWAPTWFEAHRHLGPGMPADPAGSKSLAGTRLIVGEYSDGRKYEEVWPVVKAGKKAAGRLLDGVQHDGYPEVKHVAA